MARGNVVADVLDTVAAASIVLEARVDGCTEFNH